MITRDEVKHIAKLARIDLTDEEIQKFQSDLTKVLGYIEVLKTVDTEGVEPLASVTGLENIYREDEVKDSPIKDDLLASAPEKSGRFIKVKKVF